MSRDASPTPTSLATARRLLARDAPPQLEGGDDAPTVGAALERACQRVFANLRESLGDDGCNALLTRALTSTKATYPALHDILRLGDNSVHLNGVVASVETHGAAEATMAVAALLAALIDILDRLIGDDMTIRLIEYDSPRLRPDPNGQAP